MKQYNRSMNFFEKLVAGWYWFGECYAEWSWQMTHTEDEYWEFFDYLQTDYVGYEEDTYYDRPL